MTREEARVNGKVKAGHVIIGLSGAGHVSPDEPLEWLASFHPASSPSGAVGTTAQFA